MKNVLMILMGFIFFVNFVSAIQITEIMYNPIENEYYNEWIEIYADEDINLSEWRFCDKEIFSGYVNHLEGGILKKDNGLILEAGKYAIITDGGSGTDVYSNFNINENSLALHVEGSTLCGGLSNGGKEIIFTNGELTENVTYSPEMGGENNEKSLQFCEEWIEEEPTPGSENKCEIESSETEEQNQESEEIKEENIVENESKEEEEEIEVEKLGGEKDYVKGTINLNTNVINEENNEVKEESKIDYFKWGLIGFGLLMMLLILTKKNKKYSNEFK